MLIKQNIVTQIFAATQNICQESGGILGAENGVICNVVYDRGIQTARCSYEPDVNFLNYMIANWQERKISFVGLFHTHFFSVPTLSKGDIEYIESIMHAMPKEIERLYFPIILPESKTIIPYLAIRKPDSVKIIKDNLQIVD